MAYLNYFKVFLGEKIKKQKKKLYKSFFQYIIKIVCLTEDKGSNYGTFC